MTVPSGNDHFPSELLESLMRRLHMRESHKLTTQRVRPGLSESKHLFPFFNVIAHSPPFNRWQIVSMYFHFLAITGVLNTLGKRPLYFM